MKGHLKDTCFKIHGYPEWYKELKAQQRGSSSKVVANMVDTPLDLIIDEKHNYKAEKNLI